MINKILLILLLTVSSGSYSFVYADVPGKRQMQESRVTFRNIDKFKDWEFHWEAAYGDSSDVISTDATVVVPASNGAPAHAAFWAVNKNTGKESQKIDFSNYYSPDYLVVIKSVGDTIGYSETKLSNGNSSGDEDSAVVTDPQDQQLIENAKQASRSANSKYLWYIGIPVLALGAMIFLAVRKRKANNK